ncbi:hypothetical protein C0989_000675 [Termitomyces sp. Mn162]|nr:hypothetical protein C0989_000675 [Termitomyces sp. Mn162]
MAENVKIPLPEFIKVFTANNIAVPKAMALSAKIYKQSNTPAHLAQLDDRKLISAGIDNKDDRKAIITALRQSGYLSSDPRKKLEKTEDGTAAGPSTTSAVQAVITPPKRKRKRPDDHNEFLPKGPVDEAANYGSLDFGEILDEEILMRKTTEVNRAPIMTLWAMTVAERLGFRREEALSIASVYTEMNAMTKGVSLGIYQNRKEQGREAVKGGSQSYIEFMGRRMWVSVSRYSQHTSHQSTRPLYRTQMQQWRALSDGAPVEPSSAFSYVSRAFRQTTPYITGALKLLANSFDVEELNGLAWGLYAEFRPTVNRWGARSEVKCSTILDLRKKGSEPATMHVANTANNIHVKHDAVDDNPPDQKKTKLLSLEEYEAALDEDFDYKFIGPDLTNSNEVSYPTIRQ